MLIYLSSSLLQSPSSLIWQSFDSIFKPLCNDDLFQVLCKQMLGYYPHHLRGKSTEKFCFFFFFQQRNFTFIEFLFQKEKKAA